LSPWDELTASLQLFLLPSFGDLARVGGSYHSYKATKSSLSCHAYRTIKEVITVFSYFCTLLRQFLSFLSGNCKKLEVQMLAQNPIISIFAINKTH
jgi:hypothetical protein